MNFNDHLTRQLGYLNRSCQSYDEGYQDEAIRMATIIRVLFHQTKNSTSLMRHLNATTINLCSTTTDPLPKALSFVGLGMMRIGNGKAAYFPQLGNGPINESIPISMWWNQVVMILGEYHITRKKIVLAAANKDGGAHVDTKLTKEYEALSKEGAVGVFSYAPEGKSEPFEDAHFVSLRQMAYEVISSPELNKLKG